MRSQGYEDADIWIIGTYLGYSFSHVELCLGEAGHPHQSRGWGEREASRLHERATRHVRREVTTGAKGAKRWAKGRAKKCGGHAGLGVFAMRPTGNGVETTYVSSLPALHVSILDLAVDCAIPRSTKKKID